MVHNIIPSQQNGINPVITAGKTIQYTLSGSKVGHKAITHVSQLSFCNENQKKQSQILW